MGYSTAEHVKMIFDLWCLKSMLLSKRSCRQFQRSGSGLDKPIRQLRIVEEAAKYGWQLIQEDYHVYP